MPSSRLNKLTVAITMGDPAGIGPEVVLKALKDKEIQALANFIVVGNFRVLEKTAQLCKIRLQKHIALLDLGDLSKLVFGRGIPAYGRLSLECIKEGFRLIKTAKADALITAPVNKHTITRAGYFFQGHTEYLAKASRVSDFAMMLTGGALRVVLVTRHIALKKVAGTLSSQKIYQTIRLTAEGLRKCFGVLHPRIAVCGLNPHSGDEGVMGDEETRIIRPAIARAKRFAKIVGPLAADSLFYSARQGEFDAVVAMYHDQGLIPLKMLALHQGVNLTLGLPFVRTSPDHGTAYDIAGKNRANPGSMIEAIKLAVKIASRIKGKASRPCS